MSAPSGFRRVVHPGNTGTITHYALAGLQSGRTYYWSVQAVDNSFAGGEFAPERSFVATVPPTIFGFADQTVFERSGPLVLPFTVGDVETPASELVVSAISSNPQLVGPADLVISGGDTNRTLTITPEPGQFGNATITVTVTDGDGGQSAVQFQLTVLNIPPGAAIVVSPLVQLPGLSNLTIMAPVCENAAVVLDGSQSADPDGDTLEYEWSEGASAFANGIIVTNEFAPGTHIVTLSVSDGVYTNSATAKFDVITPANAVADLEAFILSTDLPPQRGKVLLKSLQIAEASLAKCHRIPGTSQLQAFESQVRAILGRTDPVLAKTLISGADEIIQSLTGPLPGRHSISAKFSK
jgi:hypothetical protein